MLFSLFFIRRGMHFKKTLSKIIFAYLVFCFHGTIAIANAPSSLVGKKIVLSIPDSENNRVYGITWILQPTMNYGNLNMKTETGSGRNMNMSKVEAVSLQNQFLTMPEGLTMNLFLITLILLRGIYLTQRLRKTIPATLKLMIREVPLSQ